MEERRKATGDGQRATGNRIPVARCRLPVSCVLLLFGRALPVVALVLVRPARADEPDERVDASEIASTAGTAGDPMRAVEALPGFSGPVPGGTAPTFHGSDRTRFRLLGVELPNPMHPSGQRGVVAPTFVESVDVHDGAPLAFSDTSASVDLRLRSPSQDRPRVSVAFDPLGTAVAAETPVGGPSRATSVGLVLRRSVLEAWGPADRGEPAPPSLVAGPVYGAPLPASSDAVFAATPAMWDGLFVATTDIGSTDRARIAVHGASDDVRLRLAHPVDSDPALRGPASASASSLLGVVRWDHVGSLAGAFVASFSTFADTLAVGDALRVERAHGEARVRAEAARALDDLFDLRAGIELAASRTDLTVDGPPPPQDGRPRTPASIGPRLLGHTETLALTPAFWTSTPVRPADDVQVEPGLRVAHLPTASADAWVIDPRLLVRARLDPDTTARARVGIWSEGPQFFATLPYLGGGTEDVGPLHVSQVAAGADREWGPVTVGFEGWLSSFAGELVAVPDETARGAHFASNGTGTGRGVEIALGTSTTQDGWARASYALSQTVRGEPGGRAAPAATDRTHVATFAGALRLADRWVLGARLRVSSGSPVPTGGGAVWDANADAFRFGRTGTDRLPAFHQLDLRIEKTWEIGAVELAVWFDVQNAYGARNVVDRVCSFDGRACADVYGIGLLPLAGIGGSL